MEFSEVRASIRRRWLVAVVVLVLVPLVMVGYLANRDVEQLPSRYSTSGDVLIPSRSPLAPASVSSEKVPPALLQGQLELALSQDTKDVALRSVGIDPQTNDDIGFDARLSEDGTIVTLSIAAPSPELASSVLGAYITAFSDGRRQSVLDAAVDAQETEIRIVGILREKLAALDAQLLAADVGLPAQVAEGEVLSLPPGAPGEVVLLVYERNALLNELERRQINYGVQGMRALIPGSYSTEVQRRSTVKVTPPPPSPVKPLLEILIGGLLLAIALPVLLDRLDSTITEARSAPVALRARLLGTIPFMPRRFQNRLAPEGSVWEMAFRSLGATSIATDQLPKAVLVTSPMGTTQDPVAANFAAALASLGMRVALVGTMPRQRWFLDEPGREELAADLDAGLETELAAATASAGSPSTTDAGTAPAAPPTFPELLVDAHAGRLQGDLRARLAQRDIAGPFVIPPGDAPASPSILDGLPPLLEALSASGIDITVIAGPALLDEPSATILAWTTRHVLWAVEMGQVKKTEAYLAADRLDLASVAPFGIAVVNRKALRA